MELIRISDKKLKIMLTPSDMRHFELNAETFGEDSVQMHRSFQLLLQEVRRQTDFEADERQISVQYFPSRGGGCEMFISRLSGSAELSGERSLQKQNELRPLCKRTGSFHKETAFRFTCLANLLAVCRRLSEIGYIGSSTALRSEVGGYYLILGYLSSSPFSLPQELNFIVEYGYTESASHARLYLSEHGSVLCGENAVHQLAPLA